MQIQKYFNSSFKLRNRSAIYTRTSLSMTHACDLTRKYELQLSFSKHPKNFELNWLQTLAQLRNLAQISRSKKP